jgi:5S rRNA maturation endonuclease (ribonuclease M5)
MDKIINSYSYDKNKGSKINKETIDKADEQVIKAFAILGLIDDGNLICPNCQTSKYKKVEHKVSAKGVNYWTCHKCGSYGSATKLLRVNGFKLPKAVAMLLDEVDIKVDLKNIKTTSNRYKSNVDIEVYHELISCGDSQYAIDYYSSWHINPAVVKDSGTVAIIDQSRMRNSLLKKFGKERIINSGLLTIDRNGNDYWLVNKEYNVIEPHHNINGDIVAMQFRPSLQQLLKVSAHKEFKKKWSNIQDEITGEILDPSDAFIRAKERGEIIGEEIPYVPPFMSLKGASADSLVGSGLNRIAKLPKNQKIYVVEGFKDLLAARTMGVEAYAIPGVGAMPNSSICDFFKKRNDNLIVMLDGDEAGALGRVALSNHFNKYNVRHQVKNDVRSGYDVTDILVEEFAHKGCTCKTCYNWRDKNTFDIATCICRVCKKNRL